jgi:hypothetical protein
VKSKYTFCPHVHGGPSPSFLSSRSYDRLVEIEDQEPDVDDMPEGEVKVSMLQVNHKEIEWISQPW